VEVAVPVTDPAARARLDVILDTEVNDPAAWILHPDGRYTVADEGAGDAPGAQARLLERYSRSGGTLT